MLGLDGLHLCFCFVVGLCCFMYDDVGIMFALLPLFLHVCRFLAGYC